MPRLTRAVSAVGLMVVEPFVRLAREILIFFSSEQESPSEANFWGNR
jgi:hypothetical protein